MKLFCIYIFTDQKSNPYYVGQTCNFKARHNVHLNHIRKKTNSPKYDKAFSLITRGHPFTMKPIKEKLTVKQANFYEEYYIRYFRASGYKLYNIHPGGLNHVFSHSEIAKAKIKINNAKYWLGKKKTDEIKDKISNTKKEWFRIHEHPFLGGKHSETAKQKMSNAHLGMTWTTEQKTALKLIRNKIKPYYTKIWKVVSPTDDVFLCWGLGAFCRLFGLDQSKMQIVAQGKRPHHKKWKCAYFNEDVTVQQEQRLKDDGFIKIHIGMYADEDVFS